MSELIDYGTLEWFDCKNNFPPMHIDLYVDSEHGYGIGRLGKRVKDGSIIWVVHLDSGKVYLVYAFYKVKRWAYMPKEQKKSELKAFVARKIDDGTCDPVPCIEVYPRSETDKLLADKDAKIIALDAEVFKQKHHAKLFFDERNYAETQLRHQKYKRCLAMAKWCDTKADWYYGIGRSLRVRVEFYIKWYQRWLELAEKFKEEK